MKDDNDDIIEQDNFDIERNELLRLMGTAKDDVRKAIIQESLNTLESPDKKITPKKNANYNSNMFETEKMGKSFSKSPPIRPVSARLRRPSMNNLDVIQEEKRISVEKSMETYNDSHTSYIQIEDVYEFSTSCFDPNLSHWNPFYHVPHPSSHPSHNIHKGSGKWITTGLMPQFLSIDLKLCWLILEIRIVGYGIEEILLSIEGSINRLPMTRENNSTFTFSSTSLKDNPLFNGYTSNSIRSSPSKIFGDRVLFTFEKAADIFISVESVHIQAVPTGA